MNGDFTRQTFRKKKQYTGVRLQQGRVQVDADFNEWVDISHYYERTANKDIIGFTGMPEHAPGFAIAQDANDIFIGFGQAYIDGILISHDESELNFINVIDDGVNSLWQLEEGPRLQVGHSLIEIGSDIQNAFKITEVILFDDSGIVKYRVKFSKDIGNTPLKLIALTNVKAQPNWHSEDFPVAAGNYLAYLDVWEREISYLDDPLIKEVALGGVDTSVRNQVIWQLKFLQLDADNSSNPPVCKDFSAIEWSPVSNNFARLAARTNPNDQSPDPCVLPSNSGYRNLENHLYRVQIHASGNVGSSSAFIKWSSDNAIYSSNIIDIDGDSIVIEKNKKDDITNYKSGDWIEVFNEDHIRTGAPGFFARIDDPIDDHIRIIELLNNTTLQPETDGSGEPNISLLTSTGKLCRWEGGQPRPIEDFTDWLMLDNGIEINVKIGWVNNGDYWQIPGRTLTGSIEWPENEADGSAAYVFSKGIEHHYCPVAIAKVNSAGAWAIEDCRNIFPPLTQMHALFYLGGDAQKITPTKPVNSSDSTILLSDPLNVGVARGQIPVSGARVKYSVVDGDGLFSNGQKEIIVTTNSAGSAKVEWSLDRITLEQHVKAELLDSVNDTRHLPIIFSGRLERAQEVAFSAPNNCEIFFGTKTVHDALIKVCDLKAGAGCATIVIGENDDWVTILENIKEGKDAHICFKSGLYHLKRDKPVILKALGHISISGAGLATQIIAENSHKIIEFIQCKSIELKSMQFKSIGTSEVNVSDDNLLGVLHFTKCISVTISNTIINCMSGKTLTSCCISLLGKKNKQGLLTSVDISNNVFNVGNMQNGIFVEDVNSIKIKENNIRVVNRTVDLSFDAFLTDRSFRLRLMNLLIESPIIKNTQPINDNRIAISVGEYIARINSLFSEIEFNEVVIKRPPKNRDLINTGTFKKYVNKLIDFVVEKPKLIPSFEERLKELGAVIRDDAFKKALLLNGDIVVNKLNENIDTNRRVKFEFGNFWIAFDSLIEKEDWLKLFKLLDASSIRSNENLLDAVLDLVNKVIIDNDFRIKFPIFEELFKRLRELFYSVGYQAINIGGDLNNNININDNEITGFSRAITINLNKLADERNAPLIKSINIDKNEIILFPLPLLKIGEYGIFIDNGRKIVLENNSLYVKENHIGNFFEKGIFISGKLGSFVIISQSYTTRCIKGIHVVQKGNGTTKPLWRAIDNLVELGSSNGKAIDVPDAFIERDNIQN